MGDMFSIEGEVAYYIQNLVSKSGRMGILGARRLREETIDFQNEMWNQCGMSSAGYGYVPAEGSRFAFVHY